MGLPRLAKQRVRSSALLLRRVPYRESDVVVTLFTEQAGALSAVARAARRSKRRFAGLEPMHLLRAEFDVIPQRELATLLEVRVERPRLTLTSHLDRMSAAGQALRWVRRAAPQREAEPRLWIEINALLDALDTSSPDLMVEALLGAAGLRLLEGAGWGLDLSRCVRCDRPCPDRARAGIDVVAGGLVCRACGGGGVQVTARQRRCLQQALAGDETALGLGEDAAVAVSLVQKAFAAHGDGQAG